MPEEKMICPPFIRHGEKSRTVMLDVLLALVPALIWSIYIFGARAAVLCAIGIAFAVAAEFCCDLAARRRRSVVDFSAAVTGLLIAFGLPVSAPLWMPALLSVFAVVVVKKLCGGIGRNLFNPAAASTLSGTCRFSRNNGKIHPAVRLFQLLCHPTDRGLDCNGACEHLAG